MLKKFISSVIILSFVFLLFSCGENTADSSPLEPSEFISAGVDEKTSFRYDEYEHYVIVTGVDGAPDNIEIPETLCDKEVKAVSDGAFADMGWVKEIKIPDTVAEIGERAFYGCVSAEKITLSENLYSIGSSAFFGAKNLENVRLPLGLKLIGGFAFADCEKLEGVSIPQGTESIGGGAFQNTVWLGKQTEEFVVAGDGILIHYAGTEEKVTVPEDVKVVSAFCDNFFVEEVVLPDSAVEIGEYAFVNSSLKKITLSENIRKIGNGAFDSCLNLENVTVNKKLEEIGSYAFAGCQSLKAFTVTEKVKAVGDGAFARCSKMENLVFESAKTEIGDSICDSCLSQLKLSCPKNSPVIPYAKNNNFILDVI